MGTPILTDIESRMAGLIGDMSIGDGYNFDWGSVNELDKSKWSYPAARIRLESEENQDDLEGAWARAYLQEAIYVIEVQTMLYEEAPQPTWVIDAELNKALDDLKRLFGINYSVSGKCDVIMYVNMTREMFVHGDMMVPKRMFTRWRVRYTQDRQDPSISAE